MSGKKVEDRYKARSQNSSKRGSISYRGKDGAPNNKYAQASGNREYYGWQNTRRKSRLGCFISIVLFVLALAAIYIVVFESPLLKFTNAPILDASPTAKSTQSLEFTPTPSPNAENTPVPTPTPEPISSLGYISIVNTNSVVRMRVEPNQTAEILNELHDREALYLISKNGDYYRVEYRGETGYVHEDYIVEHWPEDNMLCDTLSNEIKYTKLVEVTSQIPTIKVEMPYATESNHANIQMYPYELVLLQESTVQKLKAAQEMFLEDGYSIVIWDAYRPYSVTKRTFDIIGNPALIADPEYGSKHNRGAAVDITLFNLSTNEYVDLPTEVREMDIKLSSRTSPHMTFEQMRNMQYMERIMRAAGFSTYEYEWWHYNDMAVADYPVLDIPFEAWKNR